MTVIKVSWESRLPMRDVVSPGLEIAGKKVLSVGEKTAIGITTVALEGNVTILFGMNFSGQGKESLGFMNCVIERQIPDDADHVQKKAAIIRDLTAILTTTLMLENQDPARKKLLDFSTEKEVDNWQDDVAHVLAEVEAEVNSNPGFIARALGEVRSGVSALKSVLPTHQVGEVAHDAGVAISRVLPGTDDLKKTGGSVLGVVKEGVSALAGLAHRLMPSRRTVTGEGREKLADDVLVLKTKPHFESEGDVPANKRPGSR